MLRFASSWSAFKGLPVGFSPKQLLIFEVGLSLFLCQCLIPKVQDIDWGCRVCIFDLLASTLGLVLKGTKLTGQRKNNPTGIG